MKKKKKYDTTHANIAKSEAVMKGLNLALKWGWQDIRIKTDLAMIFI